MESFDAFFDDQQRSLLGQAYMLTGDIDDARDLVQEVFVRVWQKWDRVSSMQDPAAWARRVLRNLAIGRWRRRKRRGAQVPLTNGDSATEAPDVGHLDVVRALYRLPGNQRVVLILHDVVGLSVKEVAAEIGSPEGSVRGWLSIGRRQLGRALGMGEAASYSSKEIEA
jgi:RNA polymerase sigma-70 factor (ECF subfamily)